MEDLLVVVDENDNELGVMDKLSIHKSGVLHRAFSLFIFNSKGELLLQKRANDKYHSAGLWSNSCCSHPREGETISQAITRRLYEEMGISCSAEFKFSFIYKVDFNNGLKEHEFDHVYFGRSNAKPIPNFDEVQDWKYIDLEKLEEEITLNPQDFSEWMKICLAEVKEYFQQDFKATI
jgi:isopentenyl-diphosphate delta-isomerase